MIDFDLHEAYLQDRQEVDRCPHCQGKAIWRDTTLDLDYMHRIPVCENCERTISWNDVETFEEWAERKGIDI